MFDPKATASHLDSTIHVILAVDRLLPVYPDEQTFSVSDGINGPLAVIAPGDNYA